MPFRIFQLRNNLEATLSALSVVVVDEQIEADSPPHGRRGGAQGGKWNFRLIDGVVPLAFGVQKNLRGAFFRIETGRSVPDKRLIVAGLQTGQTDLPRSGLIGQGEGELNVVTSPDEPAGFRLAMEIVPDVDGELQ